MLIIAIKEKPKNTKPRVLDKAMHVPRTAKDAIRHVRNAGDEIQERRDESPTEYAANFAERRGRETAQEVLAKGQQNVHDGQS